jgi:uncharacterized repeat protein (TIGR03803 family)
VRHRTLRWRAIASGIILLTLLLFSALAAAQDTALHSFGSPKLPYAGLILDKADNLYGTTEFGGDYNQGAVFKLTVDSNGNWTETVLYSFTAGTDGGQPHAGLIFDAAGNLYGTTTVGGGGNCSLGCGTVFELERSSSGWTETVLHTFTGGADGSNPYARLVFDAAGNLYGTTSHGGDVGTVCSSGCGVVFRLSPTTSGWEETVLHAFGGGKDGALPYAGLTFDAAGRLYGTTCGGGGYASGTVFRLTPGSGGVWTESILHTFAGRFDGKYPYGDIILDTKGNLYGTSFQGGWLYGVVFELVSRSNGSWKEQVLHTFARNPSANPIASLVMDPGGNLYGTTALGGNLSCPGGCGTLFKLTPGSGGWNYTVPHLFGGGTDGYHPSGDLILDGAGNLYGTTQAGGTEGAGTVFRISLGAPLSIRTTSLSSGNVASSYSSVFTASAGTSPYTWSLASGQLPSGLSLAGSGAISGTPRKAGTYPFSVKVADSSSLQQSASGSFSIFIAGPLSITTASPLASATVGTFYPTTFSASGGTPPFAWSLTSGQLPPGLTLAKTGTLSGTPTSSGTYSFSVQVVDSGAPQQIASGPFSISVAGGGSGSSTLSITTTNLPSGFSGSAYSSALIATGGTLPYSWTVSSGQLPLGLSLGSNGVISGTPTTTGQYGFTARVMDSSSPPQSASASLSISISSGVTATSGATATQYVLSYTAANTNPCTIEVSTSPSYAPLVHAVDPKISAGSNLDGQTNAGARAFVVGQRWVATENMSPPSITVAAGNPSRASLTVTGTNHALTYGNVIVNYSNQPFLAGDNIVVTGNDSNFTTSRARVMAASTNSFTYFVIGTTSATSSSNLTITRANNYSLALQNSTTYYFRIGGASNTCGANPSTGTFTTMNWPNGQTWAENVPLDNNGIPVVPSIPETTAPIYSPGGAPLSNWASASVIDPITGVLMKPMGMYSNDYSITLVSGGSGNHCSWEADSNGFVHCYDAEGNSGGGMLRAVNETTGEVRYLGSLNAGLGTSNRGECTTIQPINAPLDEGGLFDDTATHTGTNPNVLYMTCETSTNHFDVVLAAYNGNDVAVNNPGGGTQASFAPLTILTPSSTGNSLDQLLKAFDSNFNSSLVTGFAPVYVMNNYLILKAARWNQGSPTWVIVFNLGDKLPIDSTCGTTRLNCPRIEAAKASWGPGIAAGNCTGTAPVYCTNIYPFRWNGNHGAGQIDGPSHGWVAASSSYMVAGQGTMGNFEMTYTGTGLNATDATDTITVTSTITGNCGGVNGDPTSSDIPPDGCSFLDQARPGDIFVWEDTPTPGPNNFNNEVSQVLARNSATSLTIARGCWKDTTLTPYTIKCDGTQQTAHSQNAKVEMIPTEMIGTLPGSHEWWNFVNDPHGHDNTNTYLIPAEHFEPSHFGATWPYIVAEGWGIKSTTPWSQLVFQTVEDYNAPNVNTFAGIPNQCGGSACNMYPKYLPINSLTQQWFWDSAAYTGGGYTDPVATVVTSGTGYVIERYNFASGSGFNANLPYFSVNLSHQLVDISVPGSSLPLSSSGNYDYCIVHVAGECYPGSTVGQAYANFPTATTGGCFASETGLFNQSQPNWCLSNTISGGQGIMQNGIIPANRTGTGSDGKPIYGAALSRKLVQGLYMAPRWEFSVGNNMTADDGWVIKDNCLADPYVNPSTGSTEGLNCMSQVHMFKVPPQPPNDGIDRTNYENVTISIGPGSAGTTHARVKYGYQENERARGTVWPPTLRFYCTQYQGPCYSSNQSLPLNSPQVLQIGVPQRVLFYQVEYLNGSNQVVASDPVTAVAIP